jgi:NPCBM/NEW2 domain
MRSSAVASAPVRTVALEPLVRRSLLALAIAIALVGCRSSGGTPQRESASAIASNVESVPPAAQPHSETPSAETGDSEGSPSPTGADTAQNPRTVYIEELPAAAGGESYDTRGVASINGQSYPHSQGAQFCFGSNQRTWEYDLGRDYDTFRATIGLSDDSTTKAVVRYEIFGDDRLIYSKAADFGHSFTVNASDVNVLRLRLVWLFTDEGVEAAGASLAG